MKKVLLTAVALCFTFAAYPAMADPAAGEALFTGAAKCKNCHNPTDKKKVGPGLLGVVDRAGEAWIKSYLNDAPATWTADEGYTKTLKASVGSVGKPKPKHKTKKLTEQEITDLVDFLKTLK
ncbi:MAG: c-type cytochrome [Nitrospinota bacterium]|nr:c-type cytochrome [Nitrospinota bacterium]